MDKKVWAALAILVVLALGAWVITSNKSDNKSQESTTQTQTSTTTQPRTTASNNSPSTESNKVEINNFAFTPANITVKIGDTVTWENMDSASHTVTGTSANGPNSETLQKGQTYSFKFTQAGTFKYACKFHPSMTGTVTVQ